MSGTIPCDSNGEPWLFAHIPWIPCLDEDGKPAKIPARREWQLTGSGWWQEPDYVTDQDMPDEEDLTGMKLRYEPGRGAWREDWEEGWVSNIRTGLWPVDVDNPALFESIIRDLGIAIPRTWRQETGRAGGGYHLLYDGRDLPEPYWAQGGLGDPGWGDLKANGWVAAAGALHPSGRSYTRNEDWPGQILPPPQWFAEFVMEQREKWRSSLGKLGNGGSGRPNVSSMEGENRNVRLISLRGALFNKVPELDDDEIEQALWAANEEFITPMTDQEMLNTVLKPKPNWVRHPHLDLIRPDCDMAIATFRQLYDLRKSAGKFYARPADDGTPAVVTEIDDELGRTVAAWWEDAAEGWNEVVRKRRQELAEDKQATQEAADERKAARRASMTEAEQLEQAKKEQEDALSQPPGQPAWEDEDDNYAEVHPSRDKINHILYHLEVAARKHDPVDLHLRVVDGPGRVVVDLCDSEARAVEITAGGWRACDIRELGDSPWFRRSRAMLPQVVPVQPDDVLATLKAAQKILGLDDEPWALVLGALIGWHFPSIDRPGGWLTGPSGAGKTTRAHMMINLIDPVKKLGGRVDLRRDERNARTKAMARYVVTLDNLSEISPDMSDWWCTLHTGVADEVRQLHTDNEMLSFDYKRVGLGTSLSLPVGLQSDALRRTLHIELDATGVHPDKMVLWQAYEEVKPAVLSAIYTVVSEVLGNLGKALAAELPGCPEMSDYARRLFAADLAYPGLHLYQAYSAHTGDIMIQRGADDPLAQLVIEAMDKLGKDKDFDGTPTRLYEYLTSVANSHPMSSNYALSKKWPADPTKLGTELTKLHAPLLRLGFDFTRGRSNKARSYRITRVPVPARDAGGDAQTALVTLEDGSGDARF